MWSWDGGDCYWRDQGGVEELRRVMAGGKILGRVLGAMKGRRRRQSGGRLVDGGGSPSE